MQEDKRIYTLKSETPVRAVLKMGLPLTAGMFIMVLYNLVDTYFIGLLHDDYQLAAVNLAYPVLMVMVAISNMVGTGGSSLIARCMGQEDYGRANHALTVGYELTLFNSLIVTLLGLLFLSPIVTGLGAKADTFEYTRQYVQVLLIGSFFTMGNYTFGQLLRAEGSVQQSIVGMITGTVANIILDPIFIFALHLEIRGAAIATILGNGIGALSSLLFYVRKKTLLQQDWKHPRPTWEAIKEIYWVGIPASLETLLTSTATIVLNNLAAAYGALTVAAMGISSKLMTFGAYVYQGFAAGVQPIMGYNYGARNYRRMLAILKAGVLVTSGIELGVMAVYGIFAPHLIGLFSQTPDVIEIGSRVLRANMCILPFVSATSMSRSSFQAMGKPMYALSITIVRQLLLFIPLLLLMDHLFGFYGLIWAQPITEAIMMIVSLMLLTTVLRKLQKA